jgi:hypothetical protein
VLAESGATHPLLGFPVQYADFTGDVEAARTRMVEAVRRTDQPALRWTDPRLFSPTGSVRTGDEPHAAVSVDFCGSQPIRCQVLVSPLEDGIARIDSTPLSVDVWNIFT